MNVHETILEDYLWHTYRLRDTRVLKLVKRVLSAKEQGAAELHASLVSGKKLVVICEHPERLREVILIGRLKSGKGVPRAFSIEPQEECPRGLRCF